MRVLLRVLLTNADAATEGAKLSIESIVNPEKQHCWIAKWFTGGAIKYRMSSGCDPNYEVVTGGGGDDTNNTSHDIFGLVFTPDRVFEGYSGAYSAGELMRLTQSRGNIGQNIASPTMRFSTDATAGPRLCFCQVTNNATGALTTTFTHMRVDFAPRHADL